MKLERFGRHETRAYADDGSLLATFERPADAAKFAAADDLLHALENLLAEFDAYDRAMAEIGRGHEDYGGQRAAARVAILQAKKGR